MSKKIVTNLLRYAVDAGASNLVVSRQPQEVTFDYFLPGGDKQSLALPKKLETQFFSSLEEIMALIPGELVSRKYCRIHDKKGCLKYYLTILPAGSGEKIIINIVPADETSLRLSQLGLQPQDLKEMKNISAMRSGLIVISSPASGGKSTTLRSLLSYLNDPKLNIYFMEENPKDNLAGVNYLRLCPENWSRILKQDSDLIFTDLEEKWSLEYALRAASTGRLVVGTLTASSSFDAFRQILAINLPLKLRMDSLKMIVNQRLMEMKRAKLRLSKNDGRKTIGLFEILKITPALRTLVQESKETVSQSFGDKFETMAAKEGFRPLKSDKEKKILNGLL